MSETLIAAILSAIVGPVLVVLAGAWIRGEVRKVRRDTKQINDQVSNTHDTNLRDDLDSLRDEVRAGFSQVNNTLSAHSRQLANLSDADTEQRRDDQTLFDRIRNLERKG